MDEPLRVLIIEDDDDDASLLERELRRTGPRLVSRRVQTAEAMTAALDDQPWDVVLADYALPTFSAPEALALLRRRGLDVPFVIVSGTIGEETAVAAMRAGAHDYLMKGNLARLGPVIQRELREAEGRRQRARAEQQLARERSFSGMLLDGVNALVVGLDLGGRITLFNRAAEAITGYRRDEVLGRNWFELLVPRARHDQARESFQAMCVSGLPGDLEAPIVTARGEERLIAWRNTVLRVEGGTVGSLSFGIDVTDRQRAEEQHRALQHAARRAEKLAALGTLAAGLAHELNNPIGIISSRIELMLMDGAELPREVREDLAVLHRSAQRVARITQSLLSFARQSSGQWLPVDLNYVVGETLVLAEKQMTKAGIQVTTELDPELPPILGDSSTLQQVLLNLIKNAWDALDEGGEIRIVTRVRPGHDDLIELVVADTGRGILPDDIPKIFDPFFSTKPTGTGLGLSITDGIVREHGGTIDVESSPGMGTQFVITFPALVGSASGRRRIGADGHVADDVG